MILRDQRADLGAGSVPGAESTSPPRVDRVILYVDDLDRCRPADVVRVLELVHVAGIRALRRSRRGGLSLGAGRVEDELSVARCW